MQRESASHEARSEYSSEQWRRHDWVGGFHAHDVDALHVFESKMASQRRRQFVFLMSHTQSASALQSSTLLRAVQDGLQMPVERSTTQSERNEQSVRYGHSVRHVDVEKSHVQTCAKSHSA